MNEKGDQEQPGAADRHELELTGGEFRALVETILDRLAPFLSSLSEQPAFDLDGVEEILPEVREPLPEAGRPIGELLDLLFDRLIPKGFNTASPGYLAFIPGGGLPESAAADLIAGIVNRFVGVWKAAPGPAQLEATVVRWICDVVGYPQQSSGFLTTGGSLANWSAIVTARRCRLPENFFQGTLYVSDQAHHSVIQAAMLAGFPTQNVRSIGSDATFRINMDQLADTVEQDRRDGFQPFFVLGNAGTTNTGAVDDLARLAEFTRHEKLWLHVDAAYGGFFALTERGRVRLRGIDRADSITLDPHKGLFLPYGNGALVVRDGENLRRAHQLDADYLPKMQEDRDRVDFCQISPELSRDFRGLRIWLPIKLHGIEPFRKNLDEKLDLIVWATEQLRGIADVEIVAEPQLTVVAFRLRRPGLSEEELNRLNRRFLDRINAGKRIMLTPTILDGRFVIRICVLSFRTHQDRMDDCLNAIRTAVGEL